MVTASLCHHPELLKLNIHYRYPVPTLTVPRGNLTYPDCDLPPSIPSPCISPSPTAISFPFSSDAHRTVFSPSLFFPLHSCPSSVPQIQRDPESTRTPSPASPPSSLPTSSPNHQETLSLSLDTEVRKMGQIERQDGFRSRFSELPHLSKCSTSVLWMFSNESSKSSSTPPLLYPCRTHGEVTCNGTALPGLPHTSQPEYVSFP